VIVADTSIIAPCVLPGDTTESALEVYRRDPEWVAPPLWRSEVRNVLASHMRLKRLPLAVAREAWRRAASIVDDAPEPAATDILDLAHLSGASAYDCEFVAVAKGLGLRLVTADRRLARLFPTICVSPEAFVREAAE
jgi:predicted nucleic acid-binding protein